MTDIKLDICESCRKRERDTCTGFTTNGELCGCACQENR